MKKCVSLIRVSTDLQQDGTSLDLQREKLTEYADSNNLQLIDTYQDIYSGGYETRDGIEKVKDLIKSKSIDVVLIYKVDRLFRSMLAFSKFYKLIEDNGIELISVSENLRSGDRVNSLVFNLMMSVATYEKSTIVNRLNSGRHYRTKQGLRGFGGKVPFGYKRDQKGNVVIDDNNSKIVQYIYKKINQLKSSKMSKTKKTQHLLKLLKSKNYLFNGKQFDRHKVRQILSNKFYMGELKYGNTISVGQHQPIVSKRLFNLVHV